MAKIHPEELVELREWAEGKPHLRTFPFRKAAQRAADVAEEQWARDTTLRLLNYTEGCIARVQADELDPVAAPLLEVLNLLRVIRAEALKEVTFEQWCGATPMERAVWARMSTLTDREADQAMADAVEEAVLDGVTDRPQPSTPKDAMDGRVPPQGPVSLAEMKNRGW